MPPRSARTKSNAKDEDDGPTSTGWDAVQECMLGHDEDMIGYFVDDIDTLLVFAGLFSAVLTAFVIVSIVLLQQDNSQVSVQLLSLIALQNGAPEPLQPFLNATATSLPTSTSFEAPANIVAINTLWFISLVFSLAAALLGILAKQWCRQYLRWHKTIGSARDNVLLRQMRYEAWESWGVPSYIACIPAILEFALIAFLVGLLVFIPTFSNRTLTVLVSIVIGATLLATFVLTLLPVFYRLCPFQSPTGWPFVRLAGPLVVASRITIARILPILNQGFSVVGSQVGTRWAASQMDRVRQRQERSEHEPAPQDWCSYDLRIIMDDALCRDVEGACNRLSVYPNDATVDTFQTGVLLRAITWVRHAAASDDEATLSALPACFKSIHTTNSTLVSPLDNTTSLRKSHFVSSIYAVCHLDLNLVCDMMQRYFYEKLQGRPTGDTSDGSFSFRSGPPFRLGDRLGPFLNLERTYTALWEGSAPVCAAWEHDPIALEVALSLVLEEIRSLVEDWLGVVEYPFYRTVLSERIALLFSILRCVPSDQVWDAMTAGGVVGRLSGPLADTLEEVFRKITPHTVGYSDGLVLMSIELCQCLGRVTVDFEDGVISVDRESILTTNSQRQVLGPFYILHESNLVSTWAGLAVQIYQSSKKSDRDELRHLFVTLVPRIFDLVRARLAYGHTVFRRSESLAPVVSLLSCMTDVLQWAIAQSRPDCGAYVSLTWLKDLVQLYRTPRPVPNDVADQVAAIPFTGDEELRTPFLLVLRLAGICLSRGLVTGTSAMQDFSELLQLLKYPDPPTIPPGIVIPAVHEDTQHEPSVSEQVNDDEKAVGVPQDERLTRWLVSPEVPRDEHSSKAKDFWKDYAKTATQERAERISADADGDHDDTLDTGFL